MCVVDACHDAMCCCMFTCLSSLLFMCIVCVFGLNLVTSKKDLLRVFLSHIYATNAACAGSDCAPMKCANWCVWSYGMVRDLLPVDSLMVCWQLHCRCARWSSSGKISTRIRCARVLKLLNPDEWSILFRSTLECGHV